MLGEYEIEDESGNYQKRYGLKAFSPIAKGFQYQDYDDLEYQGRLDSKDSI